MDKLFISMFLSERGGKTRQKIVIKLLKRPYNANQLSKKINMQYRTIKHHLNILLEENIIEKENKKYGALYSISYKMKRDEKNFEKFKKQIQELNS
ncbi:MAG: winged helix-turn-helix domain-containing protein [Methanobacteriaceae archaeon]|jgi:DNA-binding transcriptional ArsR family regulator|nr:winged helix-turn-helix domain-containing protein [Methanobacteriaceae archaeon]